MDLMLEFAAGQMNGNGNDDIGPFLIKGRYDASNRECYWTKSYVGRHDVFYRGFREGKGIWGVWEIGHIGRGGFHIWPRRHESGLEETESEKKSQPSEKEEVFPGQKNRGQPATQFRLPPPLDPNIPPRV